MAIWLKLQRLMHKNWSKYWLYIKCMFRSSESSYLCIHSTKSILENPKVIL
jgi:hypothetical protein